MKEVGNSSNFTKNFLVSILYSQQSTNNSAQAQEPLHSFPGSNLFPPPEKKAGQLRVGKILDRKHSLSHVLCLPGLQRVISRIGSEKIITQNGTRV